MQCPFCLHEEFKVTDSRNVPEQNAIRRRRECLRCQRRFTTFETIEVSLQVQKSDGRFEDFQAEKLVKGIEAACRHTKISLEEVKVLAYQVTREVMEECGKKATTQDIGERVMKYLQRLDPVAYIRFACVYRRFKDFPELMDAINSIRPKDQQQNEVVTL